METLASESDAGLAMHEKLAEAWAFHHPRYATFFMEIIISIHSNYNLTVGYRRKRSICQVYRSRPINLFELKDVIHRDVSGLSCNKPDVLLSAIAGFVTRLKYVISFSGGYVEHILL
ncbi:hypothetical protein NPIL_236921 [Nephila pilipes]|uniref:Uncharacterized protein n=1 Tax=Nephila pilipes TaxID=299642 RepID=A0A8X6PCR1_NEPPI|nr:hypothetical protein NPIL_236921 [Nephila pilipes]